MTKIKVKANGNVIDVDGATVAHMVPRFAELVKDQPAAKRYEPKAEQDARLAKRASSGTDA